MLTQQLYDSYMHFAYVLYSGFCYVFAALMGSAHEKEKIVR